MEIKIVSSVNKSLHGFLKRKFKTNIITPDNAVSVITCTNQTNSIDTIINNFNRQDYPKKELIIIINNNDEIVLKDWKNRVKNLDNINVYKISEKISLGKCLNLGVSKAKYGIISKFDDDDYYGPNYLSEVVRCFDFTRAKLIGKGCTFVYLANTKLLTIRNPHEENKYTNFVNGSTLTFKKEIFNKVSFKDITVGEDIEFCKECVKNNILIYSCSRYNHAYIRYPSKNKHTWIIEDDDLINLCCKPHVYKKFIKDINELKFYVDI